VYCMEKPFDEWNEVKKSIHTKEERLYFREGEIWWVHPVRGRDRGNIISTI